MNELSWPSGSIEMKLKIIWFLKIMKMFHWMFHRKTHGQRLMNCSTSVSCSSERSSLFVIANKTCMICSPRGISTAQRFRHTLRNATQRMPMNNAANYISVSVTWGYSIFGRAKKSQNKTSVTRLVSSRIVSCRSRSLRLRFHWTGTQQLSPTRRVQ